MGASRRRWARPLLAAGLVCLCLGAWSAAQYRALSARGPYFVRPFGLAVDDAGEIYVGVNHTHIHVYDGRGRPLRGWRIPAGGDVFRLRLAAPARIEVAPSGTGQVLTYDAAGTLLSSLDDADAFERIGSAHDDRFATASGAEFRLTAEGLVRSVPAPREVLVRLPPAPLALLGPRPLIPLLLLLWGALIGLFGGIALSASPRRGG